MKITRLLVLLAASMGIVFFAGCSSRKPILHVFTWADYIDPALVEEFERQYDCRVVIDTFDSNESMYAKIRAGAGGYDVIFPSSYMAEVMFGEGLLLELDHEKIPNLRHVDRRYLEDKAFDKEMVYSVPYMLGSTGFAYLSDRVEDVPSSWAVFHREDLRGRVTLLNDMRETLGAALRYLGYSLNSTDEDEIVEAGNLVKQWRMNLAKFENEQYKAGLASAEFMLVHGYSGDILQAQEDNDAIVYVLPEEGFSVACDDMVIPATARQLELAYSLINFLHEPENAAQNTEWVYYLCPNETSYDLLSEETRENPAVFITSEILGRAEIIRDLGPDNQKYIRVWNEVKSVY